MKAQPNIDEKNQRHGTNRGKNNSQGTILFEQTPQPVPTLAKISSESPERFIRKS